MNNKEVRIDKWLWSVRIFKTRNQATEACKKGKVLINDNPVKPSRIIKINEVVKVKKLPVIYSYKVIGLLSKRVSAKLSIEYVKDITPDEELLKLQMIDDSGFFISDKGTGRPTKKERRTIDKIRNTDF